MIITFVMKDHHGRKGCENEKERMPIQEGRNIKEGKKGRLMSR